MAEAGRKLPGRLLDPVRQTPRFLPVHPGGHERQAQRRRQLPVVAEYRGRHAADAGLVLFPVEGAPFPPHPASAMSALATVLLQSGSFWPIGLMCGAANLLAAAIAVAVLGQREKTGLARPQPFKASIG